MICSSAKRFLFIVRLHLLGRTLNLSGGNLQWQVTVGERSNLAKIIETVISATRDGELDAAFENAKAMPRNMKKKAA
jgi:hypothetical protein